MWNPKTSRTWSFGSYQGWTPPPNFYRQPNAPPPAADSGQMGAFAGEAQGARLSDPRAMSPFPGAIDQTETPPTLRGGPAGYRDNFGGASPRQIFGPNFGANPSPIPPAAAAGMLPFMPDGSPAPGYSNFSFPRPQIPHEFQQQLAGFPCEGPPPRVEVSDENRSPQRPIGSFSPSHSRASTLGSAGDPFLSKASPMMKQREQPNAPPPASRDDVFSFRFLSENAKTMENADLLTAAKTVPANFGGEMASNIWSVENGNSQDNGAADVMRVALGNSTPQFGSIGELVLAESGSNGARSEPSRLDHLRPNAGVAGVPLYFGGCGDAGRFPLAFDFAEACGEDYPDAGAGSMHEYGFGFQREEQSPVLPSPMPPKPKLVPNVPASDNDSSWQTVTRTCDKVVARAISHVVLSFGGGAVEQGRIGNALSKEETLRSYIKDKHGSLINFFLSEEAARWFKVSAGVNGCYYVEVKSRG